MSKEFPSLHPGKNNALLWQFVTATGKSQPSPIKAKFEPLWAVFEGGMQAGRNRKPTVLFCSIFSECFCSYFMALLLWQASCSAVRRTQLVGRTQTPLAISERKAILSGNEIRQERCDAPKKKKRGLSARLKATAYP